MTTLIQDFDGTLVDSCEAIGQASQVIYAYYGLAFDEQWIMDFIIKESVKALLHQVVKEQGLDFAELSTFFKKGQEARDHLTKPMSHLTEALAATKQKGMAHSVYMHKGITASDVLERLGACQYFTEMVTPANGFARKPEPETINYLLEEYGLGKTNTCYVGDRRLGIEAAENAGIRSINLGQPSPKINQHIANSSDIVALFND